MKVLPFLITKSTNKSFHFQENCEKHFYEFLHQHPEIQITLILEGEGQLLAGDYVGDFKPGDMFIIGSNMPHVFNSSPYCFLNDFEGKSRSLSIFFDWEVFGRQFWNMPEFKHIFTFKERILRGLKIDIRYIKPLKNAMFDLVRAEGFDRILILLRILNFITTMEHFNFLSNLINFKIDNNNNERLNKIYEFTIHNYHKEISLQEVAELSNLALNSFCRFFKKSTQKTYFEFLNEVRIGHACKLLEKEKSECVYNICFSVGFSDLANFNRHFKKITGFTPTEYKSLSYQKKNQASVATAS